MSYIARSKFTGEQKQPEKQWESIEEIKWVANDRSGFWIDKRRKTQSNVGLWISHGIKYMFQWMKKPHPLGFRA